MKILYGKCFGLGNAVMSLPTIRALAEVYGPIDVLVGTGPDDFGASAIMTYLPPSVVRMVHENYAPLVIRYDIAIMAIPFDGRWQNMVHFNAESVMDCRPRPDYSPVLGLSSWKKHEIEYQMDNARELGYHSATPPMTFFDGTDPIDNNIVYLGMGFKRDQHSFWSQKNWGVENFVEFIGAVKTLRPGVRFIGTGNMADLIQMGAPIMKQVGQTTLAFKGGMALQPSFKLLSGCGSYFGNDTGMMHVAASMNKPTYTMMALPGSEVKNPPWCRRNKCNMFDQFGPHPIEVAEDFAEFVWGSL